MPISLKLCTLSVILFAADSISCWHVQAYVEKVSFSMESATGDMQRQGVGTNNELSARREHSQKDASSPAVDRAVQHADDESGQTGSRELPAVAGCPYIGFTASSNFMDAQSLWDASMAFSIAEHLRQADRSNGHQLHAQGGLAASEADTAAEADRCAEAAASGKELALQGPLVFHVCGKFHSEGWMGINEHLHQYRPGVKVLIVTFLPTSKIELTEGEFFGAQLDKYGHYTVLTDMSVDRSSRIQHAV